MTFVRFSGCNLTCRYCDTPETRKREGPLTVRGRVFNNPVSVDFLADVIAEPEVAITGGEPLLQAGFLAGFCARLKARRKAVYLDTNGTLPEALARIIGYVDWVAMDIKVPSATGQPGRWKDTERSLRIASRRNVFVKLVVDENLRSRELERAVSIVERTDPAIPMVIQPVFGSDPSKLLGYQAAARKRLKEVRIIPQIHKYLNMK
jgi:organic radical activating enzyme